MKLLPILHPQMRLIMPARWYWLAVLLIGGAAFLTSCSLPQRMQPTATIDLTDVYSTLAVMMTTQPATTPSPNLAEATAAPATPGRTPAQVSPTPGIALASETALPTIPVPCNQAAPGSPIDVTIPDNTLMSPGEAFTKIWRLQNAGSCPWTVDYRAAFFYGDRMDAPDTVPLGQAVQPGAVVEIIVEMIAPLTPGTYQGNWKLSSAEGVLFGIGPNGDAPFWVRVIVYETLPGNPSATPTATLSPATTPTITPSPTLTPPVGAYGSILLPPANLIDLDTLGMAAQGADLEYQTDANNYHWLTPMGSALLGISGSLEPGLEDCLGANMSSAPIAVESLAAGTYLCYRTDLGATGRALLFAMAPDSYVLTLELLTWALPSE